MYTDTPISGMFLRPAIWDKRLKVYYYGIKIFNNLPHNIKDFANETKLFRNALKSFPFELFL